MAGTGPVNGKVTLGSYQFNIEDTIGHGSFGVVYEGKNTKNALKVAIKQCRIQSDKAGSTAMAEIKNFQYLHSHPHIVKLHDFHFKNQAFWLILEFCDAGDLECYFRKKKRLKPLFSEQINIMYQCASAVAYMHGRKNVVIHRDIKPGNILMKIQGDHTVVKVTDFGISKIVETPGPVKTLLFSSHAGTPGFMAPESFLNENYDKSVDVFAMGLLFLAMINYKVGDACLMPVTGKTILPIGGQMAQLAQMDLNIPEFVKIDESNSSKLKRVKEVIKTMIKYHSKERCSMQEVTNFMSVLGGQSPHKIPKIQQAEAHPIAHEKRAAAGSSITENRHKIANACDSDDDRDDNDSDDDESDDEEGQIGFRIMKRVLDQALHDRLHVSGDLPHELKDLPFQELLGKCIKRNDDGIEFEIGEQVKVLDDNDKVAELQEGYGGWGVSFTKYIGTLGVVSETVMHMVQVLHDDGNKIHYNPKALIKTGDRPFKPEEVQRLSEVNDDCFLAVKEQFKRFDVVALTNNEDVVKCMQDGHGEWVPKMKKALGMKGLVNRVDGNGDVFVEFINHDNWAVNPELLMHVDMSCNIIEAGDYVLVIDNNAKQRQKELGIWERAMEASLGHPGVVRKATLKTITVASGPRSFKWHPELIRLVAKGEEMMQVVLKNNLKL